MSSFAAGCCATIPRVFITDITHGGVEREIQRTECGVGLVDSRWDSSGMKCALNGLLPNTHYKIRVAAQDNIGNPIDPMEDSWPFRTG